MPSRSKIVKKPNPLLVDTHILDLQVYGSENLLYIPTVGPGLKSVTFCEMFCNFNGLAGILTILFDMILFHLQGKSSIRLEKILTPEQALLSPGKIPKTGKN